MFGVHGKYSKGVPYIVMIFFASLLAAFYFGNSATPDRVEGDRFDSPVLAKARTPVVISTGHVPVDFWSQVLVALELGTASEIERQLASIFMKWVAVDKKAAFDHARKLLLLKRENYTIDFLFHVFSQEKIGRLLLSIRDDFERYEQFLVRWAGAIPKDVLYWLDGLEPKNLRDYSASIFYWAWLEVFPRDAMNYFLFDRTERLPGIAPGDAMIHWAQRDMNGALDYLLASPLNKDSYTVAHVFELLAKSQPEKSIDFAKRLPLDEIDQMAALTLFLRALNEKDPRLVFEFLQSVVLSEPTLYAYAFKNLPEHLIPKAVQYLSELQEPEKMVAAASSLLVNWSQADSRAAKAWYLEQDSLLQQQLAPDFTAAYSQVGEQATIDILSEIFDSERVDALALQSNMVDRWIVDDPDAALAWIHSRNNSVWHRDLFGGAVTSLAKEDLNQAELIVSQAKHNTDTYQQGIYSIAIALAQDNQPEKMLAWVDKTLPVGEHDRRFYDVLRVWQKNNPAEAKKFILSTDRLSELEKQRLLYIES